MWPVCDGFDMISGARLVICGIARLTGVTIRPSPAEFHPTLCDGNFICPRFAAMRCDYYKCFINGSLPL